ncbi:hypothetical protein [Streptomyces spongiae]|uniref:Uncharacterized protein n=1 Tax=Streptomyces spongiae TaxID=565072 RepID=A0A5N8XA63_9ACTN|nr:hypothetical protein [Streptomyces spongiae]MPY56352.1 hypothetical protein [Streptomyces spongiae]
MSENYLSGAFRQPRTELQLALDEQTGTEHVTHALRAVLTRLGRLAEDDRDLDASVRRQLSAAVDLLRAAVVGTLSAVRAPAVPEPRSPRPRRSPFRIPLPGFGSDDEERRWAREREEDLLRSRRPVVHTGSLLDQVQAALEAADRLLAEAEVPPPVRVPIDWHEDAELVNLIRDLMTAHSEGDGELALRRIDRLRKDLALRHDIEVVDFDGSNEWMFTLGTSPGVTGGGYRTTQPALVMRDGRILRRGEAVGPSTGPPAPDTDTGTGTGTGIGTGTDTDTGHDERSGQGSESYNNGGKEHNHD